MIGFSAATRIAAAAAFLAVWPEGSLIAAPLNAEIDAAIATADYAAAGALLDERLAERPGDPELRFKRARNLGHLGRYDAALRDYTELRERFPNNVDYALGRAQILSWLHRDSDALLELAEATRMAPDYQAVWQLRLSIQARQSGENAKKELEELRRAAASQFPANDWWQSTPVEEPRRWTIFAGAGFDNLDNALPDWDNQFVEVHYDQNDEATYILRMARDARFDESDSQYALGGERRFHSDWFAGADFGFASDAGFLPDINYSAHIGRSLAAGWVVDLRYRRRQYETATVGSLIGTTEKYFGNYRAAYSLGMSHLHGASNSLSHNLTVNWYPSDTTSFGVSLTTGEEAEAIGPNQILETDVRGVSVNGRHRLSERLGFSWWAGLHDQGDFYRRHYVGVAVSIGI